MLFGPKDVPPFGCAEMFSMSMTKKSSFMPCYQNVCRENVFGSMDMSCAEMFRMKKEKAKADA